MHRYPALSYPEIYVLDGGYKEFFNEYRERCEPQQYIKMEHDDHKQACERGMATFRRTTKFGRAQSYTFGAQRGIDASPSSGFTKRSLGGCSRDGVASNPYKGRPRFEQRRMASY